MNRKELITFCNENIFTKCNNIDLYGMKDAVKFVSAWRKGKNANIKMNAEVRDGFLFINGDAVGRIAPRTPKVIVSEEACYYEGMILARQGM